MTKYVVFLRGVNVGGRTIKMDDLRANLEKAGFKDAKTYLQSGNVVLQSDKDESDLKQRIEKLLAKTYNYPAKAQVVSLENLQEIVAGNPFGNAPKDYHQYVIFLENDLEAPLIAEAGKMLEEQVETGQGVVYWKVQKGMSLKSKFAKLLTKSKYKEFNTVRNINTLQKILA
jgi:uncharacterized protein (DUF1697 family)